MMSSLFSKEVGNHLCLSKQKRKVNTRSHASRNLKRNHKRSNCGTLQGEDLPSSDQEAEAFFKLPKGLCD